MTLLALSARDTVATPTSWTDVLQSASASDRPVLLEIGTTWCKPCKVFADDRAGDSALGRRVEQDVVYYYLNADVEGEGRDLAKRYSVEGYPTFLLMNAQGDILDRWSGYDGAAAFTVEFDRATGDPTTIHQKRVRFRDEPTEAAARKLGDLIQFEGYPAEAVAYYRRAAALGPG